MSAAESGSKSTTPPASAPTGAASGTGWVCPKGHEPYKFLLGELRIHPDRYIELKHKEVVTCPECGLRALWQ